MILDSSAVVCMIEEEDGYDGLLSAVLEAASVAIGTPTLFETEMVLVGREGAAGRSLLSTFLERNEVVPIAFDAHHSSLATEAFIRYGKGRHPARLNYGDCMTYATARLAEAPLLCVGEDFARTDLALALA